MVVITVTGFSIPFGPQNYSLAVQACPESPTDCADSTLYSEMWPKICDLQLLGPPELCMRAALLRQKMTMADPMRLQAPCT